MTTEDLAGGLGDDGMGSQPGEAAIGARSGEAAADIAHPAQQQAVSVGDALTLVDRALAERGRRRHLFGWLKMPGGGSEDWLAVDAYYPGHRLVVVCQGSGHEATIRELVPAHGLRLLEIRPAELDAGPDGVKTLLEERIANLGLSPRHVAVATAGQSSTPAGQPHPARAQPSSVGESEAAGVLAGLALAGALVIEVYFGVARLGLGSGNVLLAMGLSLDACSRALGTVAALRAGQREWAWWCALGGSPLTAGFALMQQTGPVKTEPAPLAGVVGLLAMVALVLALTVSALG
jgi:hypothetical protein